MRVVKTVAILFITLFFVSCAHFPTVSRTISIDGQMQNRAEILELAVDVAKSMKFLVVTKFDQDNGDIEFFAFGMPVAGLTAKVRET